VWDEKTKQRKKRHFFLFNDVLLLTKKEGSRKFWLRIYISLRSPHVNIDDGGDSPYNSRFNIKLVLRGSDPALNFPWGNTNLLPLR
jgi:hypothetical protein